MLEYVLKDYKDLWIQEFGMTLGDIYNIALIKGMTVRESNPTGVFLADNFFSIVQLNSQVHTQKSFVLTISQNRGNDNFVVIAKIVNGTLFYDNENYQSVLLFKNWLRMGV